MTFACLSACALLPKTPQEVYRETLNMDPPTNIRNLQEHIYNQSPAISSLAYFTYEADEAYFGAILLRHANFASNSDLNRKFQEVSCQGIGSFRRWTDKIINLLDRRCYEGTYVPYHHVIVYDPATQQVDHFVAEFRE